MSSPPTPSKPSREKSKTRRAFLPTSSVSSSPASSSKTAAASPTTTSRRSPPFTSSSDSEEVSWIPPSQPSPRNSTATRKSAENAMPLCPLRQRTAVRESADTPISSDSRRSPRTDQSTIIQIPNHPSNSLLRQRSKAATLIYVLATQRQTSQECLSLHIIRFIIIQNMKFVLLVLLAFLVAQASPNQPAGSKKTLPKTYLEETKGLSGSDGCPQKLQRCAGGCGLKVGRRCWALTKALGVQETTEIIKFYQDINLKKSMRSLLFRKTMSSIFLTHGGGPFPILKHEEHTQFRKNLQEIAKRNPNPKAIIIFSAHWEEHQWTLLDHDTPSIYYDYYGFPPESYNLSYSMTSSSELRQLVKNSLEKQGVPLKTDTKRGYDHGVFIPMMVLYPEKKAPVIQISILKSLNPEAHYRMGVAMRELKKMGFLIIGSGSSCHGGFFSEKATKWSAQFEQALASRIVGSKGDDGLLQVAREWSKLPHAKQMHPREEHLVPLWINLGAHEGNTREVMTYKLYSLFLSNYILS